MAQTELQNLITSLHDTFGDDLTSPQQQQLMAKMRNHLHDVNEPEPSDISLKETTELLLEDIEEQHPQAAATVREILKMLGNMGI